jgi:hypothetical protein
MAAPELVIASLLIFEAGAIFSIRLWARMVSGENAATWLNPKVAARDERKQDQLAVRCFRPLENFGLGWATRS